MMFLYVLAVSVIVFTVISCVAIYDVSVLAVSVIVVAVVSFIAIYNVSVLAVSVIVVAVMSCVEIYGVYVLAVSVFSQLSATAQCYWRTRIPQRAINKPFEFNNHKCKVAPCYTHTT